MDSHFGTTSISKTLTRPQVFLPYPFAASSSPVTFISPSSLSAVSLLSARKASAILQHLVACSVFPQPSAYVPDSWPERHSMSSASPFHQVSRYFWMLGGNVKSFSSFTSIHCVSTRTGQTGCIASPKMCAQPEMMSPNFG